MSAAVYPGLRTEDRSQDSESAAPALARKISLGQLLFHSWLISSWLSEIDVEECESESKMDAHISLKSDYLYSPPPQPVC